MGKTSLIHQTALKLKEEFICLNIDLEKSQSAADAVVELSMATRPHLSLWGKTRDMFGNVLSHAAEHVEALKLEDLSVSFRSGLNTANWQAKGDRLFAVLSESDRPVVIFLDELPILVNRILKGAAYTILPDGRKEADAFLSWLRANSILHAGRVRIVVAGSIGLEPLLRQASLNATLNTFTCFPLGPWTREAALGCLRALGNEYAIAYSPGAAEAVVDRLSYCVPHHVQMFFDNIYAECKARKDQQVSKDLVDHVYEHAMLGVRGHAELSHMEERLKFVLGPEIYPLALEIITEAALSGSVDDKAAEVLAKGYNFETKSNEVLRFAFGILEHDGYLRRDSDLYRFSSRLLKDWWSNRFSFGFIPVRERFSK